MWEPVPGLFEPGSSSWRRSSSAPPSHHRWRRRAPTDRLPKPWTQRASPPPAARNRPTTPGARRAASASAAARAALFGSELNPPASLQRAELHRPLPHGSISTHRQVSPSSHTCLLPGLDCSAAAGSAAERPRVHFHASMTPKSWRCPKTNNEAWPCNRNPMSSDRVRAVKSVYRRSSVHSVRWCFSCSLRAAAPRRK
jgi:hypothetical protein